MGAGLYLEPSKPFEDDDTVGDVVEVVVGLAAGGDSSHEDGEDDRHQGENSRRLLCPVLCASYRNSSY